MPMKGLSSANDHISLSHPNTPYSGSNRPLYSLIVRYDPNIFVMKLLSFIGIDADKDAPEGRELFVLPGKPQVAGSTSWDCYQVARSWLCKNDLWRYVILCQRTDRTAVNTALLGHWLACLIGNYLLTRWTPVTTAPGNMSMTVRRASLDDSA
jgi:hypothetical protein